MLAENANSGNNSTETHKLELIKGLINNASSEMLIDI